MLNLSELEQFVAFADCGTLSKAAEQLHISQPTITRTMQQVENAFGVSLFERGKNRITLNETGQKAVELSRTLLQDADNAAHHRGGILCSFPTVVFASYAVCHAS